MRFSIRFATVVAGLVAGIALTAVYPPRAQHAPGATVGATSECCVSESPPAFTHHRVVATALDQMVVQDLRRRLDPAALEAAARNYADQIAPPPIQLCFAPDTPMDVIEQFSTPGGPRFFQVARWSQIANGATGGVGDPITLTFSFPPDGTTIPQISGVSFPAGINDFHAWMNGIYGSQAVWQPIFESVFARWSTVAGVTYVYEPNDDGVDTNNNPGVLGVRGDLRICGKFLDGNSGVLAYNNFPDDGDMVFDSADNFFDDTTSNSLRLRNVIAHEHGHGMGELHVCPLTETKLMEPIASTVFDGPQHDDIRNAHRHYGDPNEPDNSPVQATDLGAPPVPGTQTIGSLTGPTIDFGSTLSIDADGEQDYFRLTVMNPTAVTVTVTPIGTTYGDAPQQCSGGPAFCCSGSITNSLTMANLAMQVIDTDGSTVLASADSALAGSPETISETILEVAGEYYIRVYESGSVAQPQLYTITLTLVDVPFLPLAISLPNGTPAQLAPGVGASFDVSINPRDEALVSNSAVLVYRYDGGTFLTAPLTPLGGDLYQAMLPAADCADAPEFYIQVEGTTSGIVTEPTGGAASPLTAAVGTIVVQFSDDGEADQGWASTGDAVEGLWERGTPVNNGRGDPPSDFDGSGQCWLTENDPLDVNSDIDGGSAILTSPTVDLSSFSAASITYARWLNNIAGNSPGEDPMIVEISDDAGANWTLLEIVGPDGAEASGGWVEVEFNIADFVGLTSQFQVRFTVSDLINPSVVEAGLDAILIEGVDCNDIVVAPPAPMGVAATDDSSCDDITITWDVAVGADDYEVYRNTVNAPGTASLIASGVLGLSHVDLTATPGATLFYWVKACNAGGCSPFSIEDAGTRASLPDDVTGVSATADSICGAIEVTWDAALNTTGYRVVRNTVNDFATAAEIAIVPAPATSFLDDAVATETTVFYWVVAENECGLSGEGVEATGLAAFRGDFNLDGTRNGLDIDGMVRALLGEMSQAACADLAAPAGVIDAADAAAFAGVLIAP